MHRTITIVGTLQEDASWAFNAQVQDFATDGTLVNSSEATASIGSTTGISDGQAYLNGASLALGQLQDALR